MRTIRTPVSDRAGWRRLRATQALMAVTAMFAALLVAAPPAAAHHGAGCDSTNLGAPYYHSDFWGRQYIYAHGQTSCRFGLPVSQTTAHSSLMQYYGGRWNYVGTQGRGETGQTYARTNTPASVRCYAPYTAYYFRTHSTGYAYWWQSPGWFVTGAHYSSAFVRYC